MDNKLTLRLDGDVIERTNINTEDKAQTYISPNVESLIGVIELSEDFDYKNAVAEHLAEKYKLTFSV